MAFRPHQPLDLSRKLILYPAAASDPTARMPHPSDLSQYVPGSIGTNSPIPGKPFLQRPATEAEGGLLFFDSDRGKADINGALRLLDIPMDKKNAHDFRYAAYVAESGAPDADGYVAQLRLVTAFGLHNLFHSIDEAAYDAFPRQTLTLGGAIQFFIAQEKARWGTNYGDGLDRVFGGDGDAQEKLQFGLMVESSAYGVYRIGSTAWLVGK